MMEILKINDKWIYTPSPSEVAQLLSLAVLAFDVLEDFPGELPPTAKELDRYLARKLSPELWHFLNVESEKLTQRRNDKTS